jgi:hypothetical protein
VDLPTLDGAEQNLDPAGGATDAQGSDPRRRGSAPVAESDGGWFKSAFSNAGGCVEVHMGSNVRLRDSKDRGGPVLTFTLREWSAFLCGVENGEFNLAERDPGS